MNTKRFWIAVVVVFLVALAIEFVVHGYILNNQYYKNLPALILSMQANERSYKWLAYVSVFFADFLLALFFVYIFTRGAEDKGWLGEGLRYGFLIWGVAYLPAYFAMYGWSKFPGKLLVWWIIYSLIEMIILGWVCAAIYKKEEKAAA